MRVAERFFNRSDGMRLLWDALRYDVQSACDLRAERCGTHCIVVTMQEVREVVRWGMENNRHDVDLYAAEFFGASRDGHPRLHAFIADRIAAELGGAR